MPTTPILRIAIPSPLRRSFDYLPPAGYDATRLQPGMRARVPFGRTHTVGVIIQISDSSDFPRDKLKRAHEVLDDNALLPADIMKLLGWATTYYHHPPGEVFISAMPVPLREGKPAQAKGEQRWQITTEGQATDADTLKRAPKQAALLIELQQAAEGLRAGELSQRHENWRPVLQKLRDKDLVKVEEISCLQAPLSNEPETPPSLNTAQQAAVETINTSSGFAAFLLDGVTGSGKTEVYLQVIEQVIADGRQAMVLIPEIGLTPQLVSRFRRRFQVPIAALHSGLSDQERLCAWLSARDGRAAIIIGTRSAVFTPLANPGIIIVDEEHDASFKQQEGFRYSARDVAIVRAQQSNIPIVLGSATPSLESLYNVQRERFQQLQLPERAGNAIPPQIRLLDVRHQPMEEGLSEPLLAMMRRHLQQDGQVLLFLNRRGYAPTLLCHDCGWVSKCHRCDAHMTFHQRDRRLRCHHCGSERPVDKQCPDCGSVDLRSLGLGTERIEQALKQHFPDSGVLRIDRDSTRRKGAMQAMLDSVHEGESRILIGTQMLAKGHHLPNVTLVGILDTDQGLFSADFRASERMAQLILQVAGRAGRAEKPGLVLVQTHHPDHPLLHQLLHHGYPEFARAALEERQLAELPPYRYLALLRAEAVNAAAPTTFLQEAQALAQQLAETTVELWGPLPAPMERRAGRYRAQLLLQSADRASLHRLLDRWLPQLEGLKSGRKVRWSLDVDPMEMF